MASIGKDIPNVTYGFQTDYKNLYKSDPNAALKVDVTIQAGYGKLIQGTALSWNNSAAGNDGQVIPYDPTATITGTENAPGRAYLVQSSGGAARDLYITLNDSYKFSVGDDVYVVDSDGEGSAENLGAITAIDVTTYPHMAKVTVTTQTSDNFTTAKFAYICVEGFNTCIGILEKTVDTGTGATAQGALATVIFSNAILYNGMLTNVDSNARTDISASVVGQYLMIK
jgi:hypothetical protein